MTATEVEYPDLDEISPDYQAILDQATMIRGACEAVRSGMNERAHTAWHLGEPCPYYVAACLLVGDEDPRALVAEWTVDISSLLIKGKVPITLNNRLHWGARATAVERVKAVVRNAVRGEDVPHLDRVHVQMHYRPLRNNVRDIDNLVGTLKPAIDALHQPDTRESSGLDIERSWSPIVDGDDPQYVTWRPPILHDAVKGGLPELWLILRSYATKDPGPAVLAHDLS